MNEKTKHDWKKKESEALKTKRKYLHFDSRVSLGKMLSYLENPSKIIEHSFYPLIKTEIEIPRYKYDPEHERKVTSSKKRPISYPSHRDAIIYSWYSAILESYYEDFLKAKNLSDYVLAYRKIDRKCNIHFAKEVFDFIRTKGNCVVYAYDVKGFFDNLDHKFLKEALQTVLKAKKLPQDYYRVFKSITRYASVDKKKVDEILKIEEQRKIKKVLHRLCTPLEFRNKIRPLIQKNTNGFGVPQGTPISAMMSNIYMISFDEIIGKELTEIGGLYRRYSDDIIVICSPQDTTIIEKLVHDEIEKCFLKLQDTKTEVVLYKKDVNGLLCGFTFGEDEEKKRSIQYLGFEFDGQNIRIRPSSISRYYRRMKASVRETLKRAYGKKSKTNIVFKKRIYQRYTHLGSRNFISYAYRAAEEMNSDAIRKQVRKHMKKVQSAFFIKEENIKDKKTYNKIKSPC